MLTAFNQGGIPEIALVNQASDDLGCPLESLRDALQIQVSRDFHPVWGLDARLVIADEPKPGAWNVVFIDNADISDALGYHEVTWKGWPISKVFVRTSREAGEEPSVTASHEVLEMLLDPAINLWGDNGKGEWHAYEACDAVEATTYPIDGIAVSNFQFPSWWEGFRTSGKFDYLGKCGKPFQLLRGGYSIVMRGGEIYNKFGSREKARMFAREDRRGHRSEFRLARD